MKRSLVLEDIPSDSGEIVCDVVVIGAGVSGLSAAHAAASLGAKVILLERSPFAASGASGKNAGIVCMGANMLMNELGDQSYDWLWTETTQLALELYEAAKQKDAILSASMVGSITLAVNDEDALALQEEVSVRERLGLPSEILSLSEVQRLTDGRLALHRVKGALWLPQEGRCHPWTLCAYLAIKARAAGAKLYGNSNVVDFKENSGEKGRTWLLNLANGARIKAKSLIRCAGPTSEPNERIYATAFAIDLPDSFPVFQDAAHFTYFDHRYSNGHLVCTGGPYGKAADTSRDRDYLKAMADQAGDWLPELRGREPKYVWAVDLKVSPQMVPHLVSLGVAGASIEGLGALGVLPGILLGKKAAQQLVSGSL